jgi:preprotein translocase subunit SecD
MNRYPLWKNLLILAVVLVGLLYALPNVYDQDPAMEVSGQRGAKVTEATVEQVSKALEQADVDYKAIERFDDRLRVRYPSSEAQLKGQDAVAPVLGDNYIEALTLSPDLPGWLTALGAEPMYLGLDLRGGIHVLIDVDMDAAVSQALERFVGDVRELMRKKNLRYSNVTQTAKGVEVKFRDPETRDKAADVIDQELRSLKVETSDEGGEYLVTATLSEAEALQIKKFALQQNITTLRNRVNALGVAEPVIQQQGERRIVVQLPGAQDPSRLKDILSATATLEYRLVDTEHSVEDALEGRVPPGSRLYKDRDGRPYLLKKRIIVTGNQITDASSGFDQRSGQPAVHVTLDSAGGARMRNITTENVGKPMAVVFIEDRTVTRMVDGKPVKRKVRIEEIISVANILEPFGSRFQTTGLDSTEEARDLALLLRAGALAAPIEIVEERTIGPSLGQDSIDQGFKSVVIGLALVMVFMAVYYRLFGLVADLALLLNLVLIVAVLSILQATLTLPGIAGIVLTVGMAVDANVLIFERIREEIRNGSSPQASIEAGYGKALSTIVDANITTLIAAIVLFGFGTGPIKGFAVTLFIGILSSMFTAILGTRAVINLVYGGKRLSGLAIGSGLAFGKSRKAKTLDFVGKRKLALVFSAVALVIAIGAMGVRGLNFGIDFTGGTLVEVGYEQPADLGEVRGALAEAGFEDATVQYFGTNKDVLIRLAAQDKTSSSQLSDKALAALQAQADGAVELRRVEFVGPQVGEELTEDGGLAMLYALIGILVYVAFRFEYRFAVGSVIALVHDVIFTVGVFALFYVGFDLPVLAAVLAVIGYSLNDTIVVFDRIRENFRKMRKGSPPEIVNASLNETLSRTLVTSLTTLLVLLALILFGGEIIFGFALALIVGVVVGTYSSIYVASTAVLILGISKEDLMPVKKEGVEADSLP